MAETKSTVSSGSLSFIEVPPEQIVGALDFTKLEGVSGWTDGVDLTPDGVEIKEETDVLNLVMENPESNIDHDIRHRSQDTKSSEDSRNDRNSGSTERGSTLQNYRTNDHECDAERENTLNLKKPREQYVFTPYNQDSSAVTYLVY